MMNKNFYIGQRGLGLIEIMVSLLFIAGSIIALIRFQNYLAYDSSVSQQKSMASILALQKIETLKDFQVLNTTSGYAAYQDIISGSSTYSGTTANYNIVWTVTSSTNPAYKTITVNVTWTDRSNTTQTVQLVSRVAGIEPAFSAAII